jgi:hypothetical protein
MTLCFLIACTCSYNLSKYLEISVNKVLSVCPSCSSPVLRSIRGNKFTNDNDTAFNVRDFVFV